MGSWADSIAYWLIDYHLAATVLLLVAVVGVRVIRQPARRIAIAWGVSVGLLILAFLCCLPGWPRHDIVADLVSRLPSLQTTQPTNDSRRQSTALAPGSKNAEVRVATALRPVPKAFRGLQPQKQPVQKNEAEAATESLSAGAHAPPRASADAVTVAANSNAEVTASPGFWSRLVGRVFRFDLHPARLIGLLIFLAGCGLTAFRILHGMWAANRLCRRALLAPPDVVAQLANVVGSRDRCPQLLINWLHPVPIVTGTVRPTIILPYQFADGVRTSDCRSVLAHEWAHIRNGDLWLLAVDRWLLPLLWAHPLYLWLRRTIRNDQELLADASAAAHSSPVDYAEMLLQWARQLAAEKRALKMGAALGVWERPSLLADRISKLLHQGSRVELHCSRRWKLGSLALLGSLPILLSTATVKPLSLQAAAKPISWQRHQFSSRSAAVGIQEAMPQEEVTDWARQWEIEQPAIAEVRRLGGAITTESFGGYRLVTEVNMVYGFTEEGTRVENSHFTDEALPQITRFRFLKVLALMGSQVTESSLRTLSRLSSLERLCLWDARMLTDASIGQIVGLPRLRYLELSNTEITDASIAQLGRIKTLEELSVQGSTLTGRSLAEAARIPSLRCLLLDLGDKPIDPSELTPLSESLQLRQLGLQSSNVSDREIQALKGCKKLRLLLLGECRVTNDGLSNLRESLPELSLITPQQILPAFSSGASSTECEQTLQHSMSAISVVRRFVKRIGSGDTTAAAQLITPNADADVQIAALRQLRSLDNVEWNLAYTDTKGVLAVSSEFSDRFGKTVMLACTLSCGGGQWRIDEIAPTPAREGVEHQIRRFAAAHPKARAARSWMPLAPEAR